MVLNVITQLEKYIKSVPDKLKELRPDEVINPRALGKWVDSQGYFDASIDEILSLWISLNRSIVRVISRLPREKYFYTCVTSNGDVVTLEWLISDYLQHMEHHLQQIFME